MWHGLTFDASKKNIGRRLVVVRRPIAPVAQTGDLVMNDVKWVRWNANVWCGRGLPLTLRRNSPAGYKV